MKMICYGKDCGSFPNEQGVIVEFWKLSLVKPAQYIDQINDGVKVVVGGQCSRYSCTQSVFESLPDVAKDYLGGLDLNIEFDDKKKIVGVDLV